MSQLSCPVCGHGHPQLSVMLKGGTQEIPYWRCLECSLVFQDPNALLPETDIYNADYISKRSQDPQDPSVSYPRIKTAKHYYTWAKPYTTKGNLLEIGCATGLSLKVARESGWTVSGIEINGKAAAVANALLNEEAVKVGYLDKSMFPDNHFSLVALFDVIEHIPRPVEFLALVREKMTIGGKILFVTPDTDTLSCKLLKDRWPHYVQEHVVLFSKSSMSRLLKEAGFTLEKYGWASKYVSTGMLKTHAENHPCSALYKPVSSLLGLFPLNTVIPFNLGEMCVLARKT